MILDENVKQIINSRKSLGFSSNICSTCSAGCCRWPGFAIFENTVLIYEKYKNNKLKRIDYNFVSDLNYKQFINYYFDLVVFNNTFYTFFPKVLINEDYLLATPPFGNYYSNRDYIKSQNSWINNMGCIFQSKKRKETSQDIKCILHSDKVELEITTKPIDCIFFTCNQSQETIHPTPEETKIWFKTLEDKYPNSKEKYERYNE